jgi:hypothetical protein
MAVVGTVHEPTIFISTPRNPQSPIYRIPNTPLFMDLTWTTGEQAGIHFQTLIGSGGSGTVCHVPNSCQPPLISVDVRCEATAPLCEEDHTSFRGLYYTGYHE